MPVDSLAQRILKLQVSRFGRRGGTAFARALNVPVTTFHGYKRGRQPSLEVLRQMIRVTKCSALWLLFGLGDMNDEQSGVAVQALDDALERGDRSQLGTLGVGVVRFAVGKAEAADARIRHLEVALELLLHLRHHSLYMLSMVERQLKRYRVVGERLDEFLAELQADAAKEGAARRRVSASQLRAELEQIAANDEALDEELKSTRSSENLHKLAYDAAGSQELKELLAAMETGKAGRALADQLRRSLRAK